MKKFGILLLAMAMPAAAFADEVVDDILARYNKSLASAQSYCPGLSEKIDSVKIMAGVSVAGGAVGTIGGGAATATGFMKMSNDAKIKDMNDPAAIKARAEELMKKVGDKSITQEEASEMVLLAKHIADNKAAFPKMAEEIAAAKAKSGTLGNIRTAGGFVAGAGGAVGAATSLGGLKTLDELIADMNACDTYVKEIDRQLTELRFAEPDNPAIAKMDAVATNCKGMSSMNIASVKDKMKIAGIVSIVGAAAGVVGGVTSIAANKKDETEQGNGINMVSNISSGVATLGNLGGAVISGVVLSGLMKNGDIAKACGNAF